MKVCVIDDDSSITDVFKKSLEIAGHQVTAENSSKAGLELLENEKFDVTIMDLQMPELTGMDIVNSLHQSGRIKEQKIIILTGSDPSKEEWEDMSAKGVRLTLKKPLQRELLLQTIDVVSKQP